MSDAHLLKDSNCKLLKSVNLDGTLLGMAHIAVTSAQLTNGAKLAAGEAERVVGEDDFCGAVPVFVFDVVDEGLDIDCC